MKLTAQITLFSKPSFMDVVLFTQHMSVMLKAGIPVVEGLEIATEQTSSPALKKILQNITKHVQNGASLYEAFKKYPKVFDPFYISLVEVGESSGTLEKNLAFLSVKLTKDHALQQKIRGVLLYPEIVLSMAAILGIGLALFVLPRLTELFVSLDIELPLTTRILLWIANIAQKYNIILIAGLIGSIAGVRALITIPSVKPVWQTLLFSLPSIGAFFITVQNAQFCRNLGIMLQAGIPITTALDTLEKTTANVLYKVYIARLHKAVLEGKSLGKELKAGSYPYISPMMQKMISVGEKSGNLEEMLLYIHGFFDEEIEETSKNFSTIMEPILLLVIGLVVAFVALSIISPIYQLTGSIGK